MSEISLALPESCAECSTTTYPPQGFCRVCLSEAVAALQLPVSGKVLAISVLHHSFESSISPHLPLNLYAVELSDGPTIFALSSNSKIDAGAAVSIDVVDWPFGDLLTIVGE